MTLRRKQDRSGRCWPEDRCSLWVKSRDVSSPKYSGVAGNRVYRHGPLFRSLNRHGQVQAGRLGGIDVARVVKKLAERAGLDPAKYAGHSLRAGHATGACGGVGEIDHESNGA